MQTMSDKAMTSSGALSNVYNVTISSNTAAIGDPINYPTWQTYPSVIPGGWQPTTTIGTSTGTSIYPSSGWQGFYNRIISKQGCKCDILGDFFGTGIHALALFKEDNVELIAFIDRLGIIWLQQEANNWRAYDRKAFLDFVKDETQDVFVEDPLGREEVLKRFANPKQYDGK